MLHICHLFHKNKHALKSLLNNISTIIFDLGGVVLNLDPQLSIKAFAEQSTLSEDDVLSRFMKSDWSHAFERGEITAAEFRNEIRNNLEINLADDEIDQAWSAMLLDLPLTRLNILGGLRNKYQTFVLSNTNAIHIEVFNKIVADSTGGNSIENYFDKIYYSHKIGLRKPDKAIYEYIISRNNLLPETTLFIDDMKSNIKGAVSVGLNTFHLINQEHLEEIFS